MKIDEILDMPDLESLSDKELADLLAPFIPEARKPDPETLLESSEELLDRVRKVLNS